MDVVAIIALVGFFTSVILFVYLFFSARHKQRMALIEHGQSAELFSAGGNHFEALKQGSVAFAAGIGVLIGDFLEKSGMNPPIAYLAPILILGGLALIGYYFFLQRKSS